LPDDSLPSRDVYKTAAELVVDIANTDDAGEAYSKVSDCLRGLIASDHAAVMIYDPGSSDFHFVGSSGVELSELTAIPAIRSDPATRDMMTKGPGSRAIVLRSEEEVPVTARGLTNALGMGSILTASIMLKGELIGYLAAARKTGGDQFTDSDAKVTAFMADCIAPSINQIRTSNKLVHVQEETDRILSVAPIGLMTIDPNGMIRSANPQMIAFLDRAAESELIGTNVFEISAVTKSGLGALLMQALDGRVGEKNDVHFVPSEEKAFYLHTKATPISSPEGVTEEAILVAMDISSNVRLQSQLERSYEKLIQTYQELERVTKMKSQFIDVVSHELRTPLTVMRGYLDLIESECEPSFEAKMLQKLRTVRANADRLYALVESMLDVSRLEKGTLEISTEPMKMDALLEDVVKARRHDATEKKQMLTLEIESELPLIMADRRRIRDVFNNLIDNAVKYTDPEGKVQVGARDEGKIIHVWVKDNGIGIPLENLGKIFDRFHIVASNDLSHQVDRIGLSLPISKGIVEAHGGRIWVESQVGRGSVFHVNLPKASAE
jgi:signal transduction histidine kinase